MSKQIIFMDIVQKALIDRHMKKKDLAEKMGKSQKNLSNFWKIKLNNSKIRLK